ncbi:GNAT family N-acetyltransferase, partial [Polynucleobacter sphagniphilus]|uniref:GNAT family N-acetyltransferase n=1 Tax=Polynucleobacter sphagniphilus TaxID=1743169 RepID=UPI0024757131
MSDIPNPLAAFDIFSARVDEKKQKKAKANPLKKLFSKKVAKKLFGKKFALKTRAELTSHEVAPIDQQVKKVKKAGFLITWASNADEIKEAQRLRYKVFAEEMGAHLPAHPENLDVDEFDAYCDHLLIRDQETLKVVVRISGQRDHPFQANDRSFQSERDHLFQNQRDR